MAQISENEEEELRDMRKFNVEIKGAMARQSNQLKRHFKKQFETGLTQQFPPTMLHLGRVGTMACYSTIYKAGASTGALVVRE